MALGSLLWPAAAHAAPMSGGCASASKWVLCTAQDTSPAGGSDSKGAAEQSGGSSAPPVCTVEKMDPQPPAGSQYWQGHDPSEKGAVYIRSCRYKNDQNGIGTMLDQTAVWSANGAAPAPVDPKVVAQQAVSKMQLAGPDININPKPGGRGLVGMPVWLAVNASPTTYGPNTTSATAGGVTVSATAQVTQIDWSMGDGQHVICHGPGKPYKKEYGLATSDCGYVYPQPSSQQAGGRYAVTATTTWNIDWQVTGGAETGQLTETRQSTVQVTIVESQAVNS